MTICLHAVQSAQDKHYTATDSPNLMKIEPWIIKALAVDLGYHLHHRTIGGERITAAQS
jgi:hypothetical protein